MILAADGTELLLFHYRSKLTRTREYSTWHMGLFTYAALGVPRLTLYLTCRAAYNREFPKSTAKTVYTTPCSIVTTHRRLMLFCSACKNPDNIDWTSCLTCNQHIDQVSDCREAFCTTRTRFFHNKPV